MGITFRHDAAAGLIGSYAAGQAAGQRRRQKYSMALLMQNQRQRQIGARLGARRGAGGAAAGDQIVGYHDPLPDDTVHGRAARRARARKERIAAKRGVSPGSSFGVVPDSSRRIPITQADVDQQREDAIRDEQREFDAGQDEIAGQEGRWEEGRAANRKRLEDGDYSEDQRSKAAGIMRQIAEQRRNKKLNPEERAAAVAILQGELDDIFNNPEGGPETQDDMGVKIYKDAWDDVGDEPGLNRVISFDETGKPSLMQGIKPEDLSDRNRAALGLRPLDDSAAVEKNNAAIVKAEDALNKAQQALESAGTDTIPVKPKLKTRLEEAVALAQGRLDALNAAQSERQQADIATFPGQAGQVPRRRPGELGLGDLDTGAASDIDLELDPSAPQPEPTAPNPNMQGLEPGVLAAPAAQPGPAGAVAPAPSQGAREIKQEKKAIQDRIPMEFRKSNSRAGSILSRLAGVPPNELSAAQVLAVNGAMAELEEFNLKRARESRKPAPVDLLNPPSYTIAR